jgi:hypothetical protein
MHALSNCKPSKSLIILFHVGHSKRSETILSFSRKEEPINEKGGFGVKKEAVNLFQALEKFKDSVHKE